VALREAVKPRPVTHDPRCPHPPPLTEPMAIHKDAQERMDRGEKQRQCENCGEYVWSSLFRESNGSQEGQTPCVDAPRTTPDAPDGVQTPPNA
jgi:hypothetical protein